MKFVSGIVYDKAKEKITSYSKAFIHIATKSCSIYVHPQYFPYAEVLLTKTGTWMKFCV